ncbi:hypothetical protein M068_4471 [Bacteroides fragilis str. J38-1]|nr:hypothetical protein M068_4471 [Bacteroides fragilis str. J38-1]
MFLLFSKKYKVILLFVCVLISHTGSIADIFHPIPSKDPVSSYLCAILYSLSTLCHGEWKEKYI